MILVSPRLKFDKLPQCKVSGQVTSVSVILVIIPFFQLAVKVFRNVETNRPETEERCRPVCPSIAVVSH